MILKQEYVQPKFLAKTCFTRVSSMTAIIGFCTFKTHKSPEEM